MALYHSAKGSVNYTVIGSPTIVDGVVSGFSENDYLKLTSVFNKKQNWEICFSVKNNDSDPTISLSKGIFCMNDWTDRLFVVNKAFQFHFNDQDGSHYLNTSTLNNFEGEVKVIHNNNHISLLTKNKTETGWILQAEEDTNFSDTNFGVMFIGLLNKANLERPYPGSIDLNHSYITVNGQPWFGVCPIEVKKHQLMGPVGYTVVGSPTISNGIVSGFSTSDYLGLSQDFAPTKTDDIDVLIKFKYVYVSDTEDQAIFSQTYNNHVGLLIYRKRLGITLRDDQATTVNNNLIDYAIVTDTYYFVRLYGSNGSYRVDLLDLNNNLLGYRTFTTQNALWSFNRFGISCGSLSREFAGSIDFNYTYIKVNGKLWFYQPAPTKYIIKDNSLVFASQDLYLAGPTTYTKVGNPVIEDCVASGFSANDYLKSSSELNVNALNSLEICTRVINLNKDGAIGGANYSYGPFCIYLQDGYIHPVIRYYKSSTQGYNWYSFNTSLRLTKDGTKSYFIKVLYTTEHIVSSFSEDGVNWTSETSSLPEEFTSYSQYNYEYRFGYINSQSEPVNCPLDLNETYIKVNGKLWFYGKNYASKNIAPVPAGYTYGNTTTQSIGYVDMRTQQFTAAPTGATLGRDE